MWWKTFVAILAVSSVSGQDQFECPDEFEGYYPHHISCDKYWECKNGRASLETCGNGLAFDDRDPTYTTKNCDYLYNVECGNRSEIEPPISAPNCPRLYGTYADPDDCAAFFQCRDGLSNRFTCAPGLAYDEENRVCKWADQVTRCKKQENDEEQVFECPNNVPVGIFSKHAHPEDCRQYFVCISGVPREYGCPIGTVFKIGADEFDGKCADPEDVPECSNYYGDLEFDKQELVRAGVDPEAVGAKVVPAARTRVLHNRPEPRRPVPEVLQDAFDEEELEEEDIIVATIPVERPAPVRANSFRTRPSRPRVNLPEPVRAKPQPIRIQPEPLRPQPIRIQPEPIRVTTLAPTITTTTTTTTTTTEAAPAAVPAIPLGDTVLTSNLPAGQNLGQPAKVKAGEDYYYYYYYYDEDYPEEGEAKPAN